jgi:hypothetical protein
MLADLYNAPCPPEEAVGSACIGSSEAIMLAGEHACAFRSASICPVLNEVAADTEVADPAEAADSAGVQMHSHRCDTTDWGGRVQPQLCRSSATFAYRGALAAALMCYVPHCASLC